MRLAEAELLFTLAEISVALAGFSAIVVLFKRRDSGRWHAVDGNRFNGMLFHAIFAAFFCIFPSILNIFTDKPSHIWSIASAVLGAQILVHVTIIIRVATTKRRHILPIVALASGPIALQVLNVTGIGFAHEFGPYLGGVLWHVIHASVLFVWLVQIPQEDLDPE